MLWHVFLLRNDRSVQPKDPSHHAPQLQLVLESPSVLQMATIYVAVVFVFLTAAVTCLAFDGTEIVTGSADRYDNPSTFS